MLVGYHHRDMRNMDPFNSWKGSQGLSLKWLETLQIISEQCLYRSKELEYMIVRYEHGNDSIACRMSPCGVMTELQVKRVKYSWKNNKWHDNAQRGLLQTPWVNRETDDHDFQA